MTVAPNAQDSTRPPNSSKKAAKNNKSSASTVEQASQQQQQQIQFVTLDGDNTMTDNGSGQYFIQVPQQQHYQVLATR
jgi:hypothetical protein